MAATLVLSALGLGLNLRAWILLGPQLRDRFAVAPRDFVLLVGVPLLVAALVRLPVGVLTDRYGARVMFPAVSLVSAAAVFAMGMATSVPAVAMAGVASGMAGAAFVVGGALLCRAVPYGRRGLALGVFGLGPAVTIGVSVVSRAADPGGSQAALVLAGLLVAFAVLAWLVLRDPVPQRRDGSLVRRCADMVQLAATTSLTVLYALALGGLVASAMYLPVYLTTVLGLAWFAALAVTATAVGLASLARLVGGWWTDRRPAARLLTGCYAAAAGLCLVAALQPLPRWCTAAAIAAVVICDGLAGGALLALIAKAAPPASAGAVMGLTNAAAALGAFLPAVLLIGVDRLGHSHPVAWVLLGGLLLGAAVYVRVRRLQVSVGLPVRFDPAPGSTAMTVAVVDDGDVRRDAAAVVIRLAELAANDELVVIHGSDDADRARLRDNLLIIGLRDRLPRHEVVGLRAGRYTEAHDRLATILDDLVESGTVAVAVTPQVDLHPVVASLSSRLTADRVLKISYTRTDGADLHEVWTRPRAAPTT